MIPARFENAKYEDVPQKLRELFEKIKETKKGLYVYGKVGTGKTHIAYALKMAYDKPESGRVCLFKNTTELLREMKTDFDRPNYDKHFAEDTLMNHTGLVILDDVGSEKITDWVAETFYLIINRRYNMMYPTIYTSNLSVEDLKDKIGDSTVSRIVEMSQVVELTGSDRRIN